MFPRNPCPVLARVAGGDLKIAGLSKRMRDLLHISKILGQLDDDGVAGFPDPVDARLPMRNPVIWSLLVVTLVVLAILATRAMLSAP